MKKLSLVLGFVILFSSLAASSDLNAQVKPFKGSRGQKRSVQPGEPDKKPFKDFKKLIQDAETEEGLFTIHRKREKVYLEIRPEQLERDYLVVAQVAKGIGDYFFFLGGMPLREDVVYFRRRGDHVQLALRNLRFTAPEDTPYRRAVENAFGDSVLFSLKIESIKKEKAEKEEKAKEKTRRKRKRKQEEPKSEEAKEKEEVPEILVVDMAPVFVSNWANLSTWIPLMMQAPAGFDRERSSLVSTKVFPKNIEVEAELTYSFKKPVNLPTLPDYRYMPITIHYSWIELPDEPMTPRLADDRVGYFLTAQKDFSRDTEYTDYVRYADHWRLEPKDSTASVWEPIKPITYYLDQTIPDRWKPYVKEGIEAWNRAFEAAGWKNAVVAEEAPDDPEFDPEDARYSTFRWITTHDSTFAIGPHDVDPRSGEILNADILFAASFVRSYRENWKAMAGPKALIQDVLKTEEWMRQLPPEMASRLCFFGTGMTSQLSLMHSALMARGDVAVGDPLPEEYVGDALRMIAMHEVGHTLGLRHNFKSSYAITPDRLHDRLYTARHGTSGSVMDYNPPNITADRSRQGHYFHPVVGPYDIWAIRYGYAPIRDGEREEALLEEIVTEVADSLHAYGTDEDAGLWAGSIDPLTNRWDLGRDPLAYARERKAVIDQILPELEDRMVPDGTSYYRLRSSFSNILFQDWIARVICLKMIGGQYFRRDHRGDPQGRLPFEPISAERQREALRFILDTGLSANAYNFSPELLNKLAPSRWTHWGLPWFIPRIDYPLHEQVQFMQSILLELLLDPIRLARIQDTTMKVKNDPFTMTELFASLNTAIWAEILDRQPRQINSIRRNLQRSVLDQFISMLLQPKPGTPEDARSLIRLQLTRTSSAIDRVLRQGGLNAISRAHLSESQSRIARALEAQLTLPYFSLLSAGGEAGMGIRSSGSEN